MSFATLLALIFLVAAIVTILPFPRAKKRSLLGYKSLCPFSPVSTLVLLMSSGIVWLIGNLG
jgi:hypothetical protein